MLMTLLNRKQSARNFLCAATLMFASLCASAETVEVEIKKFKFIPAQVTVYQGDTVVWINKEKRQYHNVWFRAQEEEPDYFFPGERYEKTFNKVGVFNYECGPHPKMTGTVTVLEKP